MLYKYFAFDWDWQYLICSRKSIEKFQIFTGVVLIDNIFIYFYIKDIDFTSTHKLLIQ